MKLSTHSYLVQQNGSISLDDYPSRDDGGLDKKEGKKQLSQILREIDQLQEVLYAEGKKSLLVVLQAMDAGGKDSTTRHVFGPLNPQGVRVSSFKTPSAVEAGHDFLWRVHQEAPRRGFISVFNRSHYEDVLIVRVKHMVSKEQIEKRFDHINNFERLLYDEGTRIVKFFLNISRDYQKKQFQDRLDDPEKHWKYNPADVRERALWVDYMNAFEDVFNRCSMPHAPWYIVPAERKWFRNLLVATVIRDTLVSMDCRYPAARFDPSHEVIPD